MTGQAKTNICKVAPFIVPFKYEWKIYRLKVEQISLNERKEQFRIGKLRRHIIIETNRPLFRLRGIKHRKPEIIYLNKGNEYGNNLEELFGRIITYADEQIKY